MGTWLGIDHGKVRIGVAVGDTSAGIATPAEVLDASDEATAFRRVLEIAENYRASGIVVGWPLNMDDTEGPQAKLARRAALVIASQTQLDVRMWDERLSSFAADEALAGHLTRKKKRARQDAIAAATFLQDFLSSGGPESAPKPDQLGPLDT